MESTLAVLAFTLFVGAQGLALIALPRRAEEPAIRVWLMRRDGQSWAWTAATLTQYLAQADDHIDDAQKPVPR